MHSAKAAPASARPVEAPKRGAFQWLEREVSALKSRESFRSDLSGYCGDSRTSLEETPSDAEASTSRQSMISRAVALPTSLMKSVVASRKSFSIPAVVRAPSPAGHSSPSHSMSSPFDVAVASSVADDRRMTSPPLEEMCRRLEEHVGKFDQRFGEASTPSSSFSAKRSPEATPSSLPPPAAESPSPRAISACELLGSPLECSSSACDGAEEAHASEPSCRSHAATGGATAAELTDDELREAAAKVREQANAKAADKAAARAAAKKAATAAAPAPAAHSTPTASPQPAPPLQPDGGVDTPPQRSSMATASPLRTPPRAPRHEPFDLNSRVLPLTPASSAREMLRPAADAAGGGEAAGGAAPLPSRHKAEAAQWAATMLGEQLQIVERGLPSAALIDEAREAARRRREAAPSASGASSRTESPPATPLHGARRGGAEECGGVGKVGEAARIFSESGGKRLSLSSHGSCDSSPLHSPELSVTAAEWLGRPLHGGRQGEARGGARGEASASGRVLSEEELLCGFAVLLQELGAAREVIELELRSRSPPRRRRVRRGNARTHEREERWTPSPGGGSSASSPAHSVGSPLWMGSPSAEACREPPGSGESVHVAAPLLLKLLIETDDGLVSLPVHATDDPSELAHAFFLEHPSALQARPNARRVKRENGVATTGSSAGDRAGNSRFRAQVDALTIQIEWALAALYSPKVQTPLESLSCSPEELSLAVASMDDRPRTSLGSADSNLSI
ncbi:hypothetical protein AB1Y20_018268 [Prymnesium parvum]|uniref:Uncharacterized protein n=1 Tax=Prymnesium parvum TaxID=97485 RepID=A0AB34JR00_PRYPA